MTRSIGFRGDVRLNVARVATALCVVFGVSMPAAGEPAAAGARTTLVVRLYDPAGLATRDLNEAGRVASKLLAAGGVDVRWKACERSVTAPDANGCRKPLDANEVVLRLIPSPTSMSSTRASLGFTLLDRRGRTPVLATVFMDRVQTVSRRAYVDMTLLTGRAMAHELGHLLLGTNGHSETGLMRAFWSDDDLRSSSEADWQLLPAQVEAIRRSRWQPAVFDVTGGS